MNMENKIWNEISEESKRMICRQYHQSKDKSDIEWFVKIFGETNLNNIIEVNTWDDIEELYDKRKTDYYIEHEESSNDKDLFFISYKGTEEKFAKKAIATLKIPILIDFGYGGTFKWKRNETSWTINVAQNGDDDNNREYHVRESTLFYNLPDPILLFHTEQQANDFVRYNKELLDDYFVEIT